MSESDFTAGGSMAASHAVSSTDRFRVSPTDGTTKFNAIRIPLVPIACWRLNAPAFAFDSSFVSPTFAPELRKLAVLVKANPGCQASIFAHADPVGSDQVNKHISDRRAIAIYATLTRNTDAWEELYSRPIDGDAWGTKAIQTMLATVTDGGGNPYYADSVDGAYGPNTRDAVLHFQADAGLGVDGETGPATRKVLFGAYMDQICTDDSGSRFKMKPEDFLGGGADPAGQMAMQGCSAFNPVVLLPESEEDKGDGSRNADNAPNRRVMVFLFRPRKTLPAEWPCPRVKDPSDACRAQFWPDGEHRRKNGESLRLYKDTRDTMACRFYDRMARRSPCEGAKPVVPILRVAIDVGTDPDAPKNISLSASNGPAFDGASALQMGRSLIFEIDPDSLPNPCQLVLSRSANSEAFGKSFDPEALRQALLSSDLAASDVVFGPPQPEQEELVPAPDPLGSGPA